MLHLRDSLGGTFPFSSIVPCTPRPHSLFPTASCLLQPREVAVYLLGGESPPAVCTGLISLQEGGLGVFRGLLCCALSCDVLSAAP